MLIGWPLAYFFRRVRNVTCFGGADVGPPYTVFSGKIEKFRGDFPSSALPVLPGLPGSQANVQGKLTIK